MPAIPVDQLVIGHIYTIKSRNPPIQYIRNRQLTGISPQTAVNPQCPCPVFGLMHANLPDFEILDVNDPEIPPDNPIAAGWGAAAPAAAAPAAAAPAAGLDVFAAPHIGNIGSPPIDSEYENSISYDRLVLGNDYIRVLRDNRFIYDPVNLQNWFSQGHNKNPLSNQVITQADLERFTYTGPAAGGRRYKRRKSRRARRARKTIKSKSRRR